MAVIPPNQTPALKGRQQTDNTTGSEPHDNYGPQFNVAIWFLTGIAAVFLGLRLYCKRIRNKKLWWDDYVLIAAWIALVVQTSLLSVMVHFGFGMHSYDIHDWFHWLELAYATGVFSVTAAAWSKTSFAITLLRFTQGRTRKLVWFIIVTVNLFLGCSGLFSYIQCWPVGKLWNSHIAGHCWPNYVMINYNTFASSWSGGCDILLATMPWWVINRPSLNKTERFGVLTAMSLGVFAGITSIAKTATLWAIKDPDAIHGTSLMILATAESSVTIVAASIPILRALLVSKKRESPAQFLQYSPGGKLSADKRIQGSSSEESTEAAQCSQASDSLRSPTESDIKKAVLRDREDSWLSSASEMELALRRERYLSVG